MRRASIQRSGLGGFSAFALAHYFVLALGRLRPDVYTLTLPMTVLRWHGLPELLGLPPGVHFCALYRVHPSAVLWARERKVTTIAISDSPLSEVSQVADVVLVASSAGTGLRNSLTAPMAVADALLNGVRAAKGVSALNRYNSGAQL